MPPFEIHTSTATQSRSPAQLPSTDVLFLWSFALTVMLSCVRWFAVGSILERLQLAARCGDSISRFAHLVPRLPPSMATCAADSFAQRNLGKLRVTALHCKQFGLGECKERIVAGLLKKPNEER